MIIFTLAMLMVALLQLTSYIWMLYSVIAFILLRQPSIINGETFQVADANMPTQVQNASVEAPSMKHVLVVTLGILIMCLFTIIIGFVNQLFVI